MRGVIAIGLLAGCGSIFDLEPVDGTRADAGVVAGRPRICEVADVFDTFDGNTPCAFGAPFNDSDSLEQHDGVLDINIDGGRFQFEGCTAFRPYAFTDNGVILHVLDPIDVTGSATRLQVRHTFETTPEFEAYIQFDTELRFVLNGAVIGARPAASQWWRLRVLQGTNTVAAEVSDDGTGWERIGTGDAQLPPSIAIDIAVSGSSQSPPGKSVLGAFGICN